MVEGSLWSSLMLLVHAGGRTMDDHRCTTREEVMNCELGLVTGREGRGGVGLRSSSVALGTRSIVMLRLSKRMAVGGSGADLGLNCRLLAGRSGPEREREAEGRSHGWRKRTSPWRSTWGRGRLMVSTSSSTPSRRSTRCRQTELGRRASPPREDERGQQAKV